MATKKTKSANEIKFLNGKDSKDEVYVEWYLQELKDAGIIVDFWYHPEVYKLSDSVKEHFTVEKQLKTKTKVYTKERTLQGAHTYKSDFRIMWAIVKNSFYCEKFAKRMVFTSDHNVFTNGKGFFYSDPIISEIDVKPNFSIRTSDKTAFFINQSLMLKMYSKYIQKVVYQDLFKKTFTPQRYLLTDIDMEPRKITDWQPITLSQFLTK